MSAANHNGASPHEDDAEHHRIVIVGAGFSGLGAAIRLKQEGIEDFVVLERGKEIGGTWNFNTYPGCQCDIPSHLYSFSFAPNPDWSRTYSKQPEIQEYLRRTSSEHGIDPHVRLRVTVTDASWDETAELWRIQTNEGELTAEVLVAAAGPLSEPKLPDIPGLESFQGALFHSAEWNHEHSLKDERVAVIGTGASSIQFVPHIQREAQKLHLFQRTPPWIVRHSDRRTSRLERWLYRRFPPAQRLVRTAIYWSRELVVPWLMHPRAGSLPERVARRHLRRQVGDPALRAKLEPDYRIGCKRILISNDYYPALTQPNVELISDGIKEIRPHSILTNDGEERAVDAIVLGTGFHVTDMPVAEWIRGRDGRSLAETWQGSATAYLGATVAGFPNLFMLVGPNTGLGHNSLVFMIESQIEYLMQCLRFAERSGMDVWEVRESVQRAFNDRLQRDLRGSVWTSGGCQSWYLDASGRNTTIWPGFTWHYRLRLRRFTPADYRLRARTVAPPVARTAAPPVETPAAEPALVS